VRECYWWPAGGRPLLDQMSSATGHLRVEDQVTVAVYLHNAQRSIHPRCPRSNSLPSVSNAARDSQMDALAHNTNNTLAQHVGKHTGRAAPVWRLLSQG
jgi:hypothetical protein